MGKTYMLLEPGSQGSNTMVGILLWQWYWESLLNWNCFIYTFLCDSGQANCQQTVQDQKLDSIEHVQISKAIESNTKQNNKTPMESMSPGVSMVARFITLYKYYRAVRSAALGN